MGGEWEVKTEPREEVEEEEEAQPPPTQEREVSTPFSMLCYCFFHTVQCGVRVTLLHLVRGVPSSQILFDCRYGF